MTFRSKFVFYLALLFMPSAEAISGEITIAYIERPPFYYTEDSEVKGILADLTNNIFEAAKVPHSWRSLPPKRIVRMFQNTNADICSPGWFFKPDRLAYANFTLAIYQNKPLVILIKRLKKSAFENYDTLADLFSDPSMTMGTVATYRYSEYIDQLIKQQHPRQIEVYSSASQLLEMLLANRIDYIIISPMEAASLIHESRMRQGQFEQLSFPDIPPGNKRYLMCSKSIDATTINALNAAIKQFVAPEIWGD